MPINNSCYTTVSATANAGLKDVVFTSPNKYVGEKKRGNDDDEKALGRQIQYKTTVNFTPVKKSTRKSFPSNGSLASNQKKSSVTHGEMTGIISLLENLYVDHREDETKDDDSQNDNNNNNNNNSNRYSIGEDGELLGRIPQFVFSSNGNASTVLRSARKSKKKEPVNV